jgi:hypothetical protein
VLLGSGRRVVHRAFGGHARGTRNRITGTGGRLTRLAQIARMRIKGQRG